VNLPWSAVAAREQELRAGLEELGPGTENSKVSEPIDRVEGEADRERVLAPKPWPLSRIARRMFAPFSRSLEGSERRVVLRVAWPMAAHTTISKIWSSLSPEALAAAISSSLTL
jgi:hypothetical protein